MPCRSKYVIFHDNVYYNFFRIRRHCVLHSYSVVVVVVVVVVSREKQLYNENFNPVAFGAKKIRKSSGGSF